MNAQDTYANVDEVIAMLQKLSEAGKGHYLVDCNDEYYLARKDEVPRVSDDEGLVQMGGYC